MSSSEKITVFRNCYLVRDHAIVKDDMWVRGGKIINPHHVLLREKRNFDSEVDCKGLLLAPGLIDLQINGAYGFDFTNDLQVEDEKAQERLLKISKGILEHGEQTWLGFLF